METEQMKGEKLNTVSSIRELSISQSNVTLENLLDIQEVPADKENCYIFGETWNNNDMNFEEKRGKQIKPLDFYIDYSSQNCRFNIYLDQLRRIKIQILTGINN